MKKVAWMLLLLILTLSSVLVATPLVTAQGTGALVWTDKADYTPGETVTIYGSGFNPEASVNITVTRPDGTMDEWAVTSNSSGSFTTTYLLNGITGTYTVTATDGTNTATTTFTDGPLVYSPTRYPATGEAEVVQGGSVSFDLSITADTGTNIVYNPGPYDSIVGYTELPTSWLSFNPSSLTLSAGQTKSTTVTITVPSAATPGSYAKKIKFNPATTPASAPGSGVNVYVNVKAAQKQITVTASPGGAIGGTFKVTYTKGGTTYTNVEKTTTWTEMVDAGTTVTVSQPQDIIYDGSVSGKRYKFDSYDPSSSVTMTEAKTITLVYKTQYLVHYAATGNVLPVTVPADEWVNSGGAATGIFPVQVTDTGIRCNFVSDDRPSVPPGVTGPTTVTATYQTQYYLTVNTNPAGLDSPTGEGWYDAGVTAHVSTVQYVDIVAGSSRYRFDSWTGATGTYTDATVVMDVPKTATANYVKQFKLTLATDPAAVGVSHITASPSSADGFYDINTVVSLTADSPVIIDATSRWRFDYWDVDGTSKGAGVNPITVTMNDAHTATAHYVKQYLVTFDHTGLDGSASGVVVTVDGSAKTYGDLPFSKWVDKDTTVSYSYEPIVSSSDAGKRFRLDSVTGPSSPITVTDSVTVTGNYVVQYYLTVKTDPEDLVAISGEDWYDECTPVTLTAPAFVPSEEGKDGVRYRFDHWDVDGASVEGNPIEVHMDDAHTATAHYVMQYYLTVTSPYNAPTPTSGWFDTGTEITASVTSPWPVDAVDTRYVCTGWTGTGSVPESGTETSVEFTINAVSSITWNWKTQYKVSFTQTGSGVAPTVDYTAVTDPTDTAPFTVWVKAGSQISYTYQAIVPGVSGVRYVLISVSLTSPQTVNGPLTILGTYKTQYRITVTLADPNGPISGTFIVTYTQCGTTYTNVEKTTPWNEWVDAGTDVTLYANAISGYTFNYWTLDDSNQEAGKDKITLTAVSAPHTAVANYVPFTMNGFFTDSDFNPIDSFDCVFTPGTGTSYKMSATNPGTYYYNLKITNNGPSGTFKIEVTIPLDFVLKPLTPGANPVQIDGKPVIYTISGSGNGLLTVSGVTINTGQTVKLTVHLDYARKFQYTGKSEFIANDQTTYHKGYSFLTTVNDVKGGAPTIVAAGKKVTAIGGFLTDTNGVPKGGLTVKVTDTLSTTSDPDGFYFIEVSPGSYTVKVYNSLSTLIATKTGVSVAKDQYVSVDFKKLSPADPAIQGFITDTNGTPLAGITVELIDVSGRVIATTTTNAGGYYVFRFSAPGTYTVRIKVPSGYSATTASITINVKQFQTATVNFQLTKV